MPTKDELEAENEQIQQELTRLQTENTHLRDEVRRLDAEQARRNGK